MTGFGVHIRLAEAFSEIGAPAYARRTKSGYEVAVRRTARVTEAQCFAAFQAVVDALVREELIDPTKEAIVWLGFVDIVSRSFLQIGSGHYD